jgi:hypothetical protein
MAVVVAIVILVVTLIVGQRADEVAALRRHGPEGWRPEHVKRDGSGIHGQKTHAGRLCCAATSADEEHTEENCGAQ